MDKNLIGLYKENPFHKQWRQILQQIWKNAIFPQKILKTILDCVPQLFLDPNMCGFWYICMLASSQTLVVNWKS